VAPKLIHAAPEKKVPCRVFKIEHPTFPRSQRTTIAGGHFSADLQAQAAERFVYAFTVRALMGRGIALAHNPDRRNLKSGSRES
jgi:hypothetical protein